MMCLVVITVSAVHAQHFSTLVNFTGETGEQPTASLVQGTDGKLYGTTDQGGSHNSGTLFGITPAGAPTTIYNFCSKEGCPDGLNPIAGLVLAANEESYGITANGGAHYDGAVFMVTPKGNVATIASFDDTDGSQPTATLTQGIDGNFYGTTSGGGKYNSGSVFQMTPSGVITTLYSFCSRSGFPDGSSPQASLTLATDGNFYVTTLNGGSAISNAGTVFKITPKGVLTTIYNFCSQSPCNDRESPWGNLVQHPNGNFYGTTYNGGIVGSSGVYAGTVFEITSTGHLTTLYSFCSQPECADGSNPRAGLTLGSDGNLYGVTEYDGYPNCCGTIFKITPTGSTLTTLHTFNGSDGSLPEGGLVQATSGVFYGTTGAGGTGVGCPNPDGCGTLFSMSVGLHPFVETVPVAGTIGQQLLILGDGLSSATSVTFNGAAAEFTLVSSSEITTTVPAGATTGTIEVVTPSRTLSSIVAFRVLP
jgi:uncharacterized repeat protein (TIGR03803 family)